MAHHRPPAYLRHRARNLGYSRIDGKQLYFPGPWNSAESLAAYTARIAEWQKVADRHEYPLTVAALCIEYEDYAPTRYKKDGQPTRQVANIRASLKRLIQAHRRTLLCELDLPLLVRWRDSLIGSPDRRCTKTQRKLSRSYINKLTIIVLRMLKWARQKGKISAAQLADLQQIELLKADQSDAPEAPKIPAVNNADVDAVLPVLPPTLQAMVELQRITGMRPGEVTIMRPCDLTVRTDGVMVYRPSRWKTEHLDVEKEIERLVFLGERAQAVLRPYLSRDREACCFSPAEVLAWHHEQRRAKRKSKVPPSQIDRNRPGARIVGERYTSDSYARAIARACEQAGVRPWTPNRLRKTASLAIMDSCDLDTARAQLGHRSVATTAKHYATRAAHEKAARAMKQIG